MLQYTVKGNYKRITQRIERSATGPLASKMYWCLHTYVFAYAGLVRIGMILHVLISAISIRSGDRGEHEGLGVTSLSQGESGHVRQYPEQRRYSRNADTLGAILYTFVGISWPRKLEPHFRGSSHVHPYFFKRKKLS